MYTRYSLCMKDPLYCTRVSTCFFSVPNVVIIENKLTTYQNNDNIVLLKPQASCTKLS